MRPPMDHEELAAVVADGRAYDWTSVDTRHARTLSGLWAAVRAQLPGDLAGVRAPRARLSRGVVVLTVLTFARLLVTAVALVVGAGAVNGTQLATLVSFSAIGAALMFGGGRDIRARHLGLTLSLIGAVMVFPLLRGVSAAWPANVVVGWTRLLIVESFLPAALWLFVRDFPAAALSPRDARTLSRGFAIAVAFGIVAFVANLLIGAGIEPAIVAGLDRDSDRGTYFWQLTFLLIAPALVVMMRRRRAASPDERAKVTAFVAALCLAMAPMLFVLVLASPASPLKGFLLSHFALTGALLYGGLLTLPITTAYAVRTHRVVRIELVLQASARYALARQTLVLATLGPLTAFVAYAYRHRDLALGELLANPTGGGLLSVAAVAGAGLVVRRPLLARLDRAMRRDALSLASALEQFARRSSQGMALADVAEALCATVEASFHPEVVTLLVRDSARDGFVAVGAGRRLLPADSALAEAIAVARDPVHVDLEESDGVARLLPRADQEWLADAGVVVIVPLVTTGGEVSALLALGRMTSERAYAEGDLQFLAALASAAAPAVEARLLRAASGLARLGDVDWDDESGRECAACGRVGPASLHRCAECGAHTLLMSVPARLHGKFTLRRRLGAGGMGVVYLAQDDALDRPVALKTLPRVLPEAIDRLRREARAMASVSHPAVATIHGVESWRAVPILVVEYLAGGTLAERLRRGPMAEADVVVMARQILAGLQRLHGAGLLHRDLKPSNIGFTADGSARMLDFGLSRLVPPTAHDHEPFGPGRAGVTSDEVADFGVSSLAGTPHYMSPELVTRRQSDAAADLWALAMVMTEALAGRHPWAHLAASDILARLVNGEAPDPTPLLHECSPALRALLARALGGEVSRRPKTAAEFDTDLRTLPH